MFTISNLCVAVEGKQILSNFSFSCLPGQTYLFMGPNGSGKTTLARTIIGDPFCVVQKGEIFFNKKNILDLSPDERAKFGIFLAFQYPCSIPGLTVFSFLKEAHRARFGKNFEVKQFRDLLYRYADLLKFDHSYLFRNLNEGFSGGEKKRLEMLQLLVLQPNLVILDEIDSGLDVDSATVVFDALEHARKENPIMAVLCISHHPHVVEFLKPDLVHIISDGAIVCSGGVELAQKVQRDGYNGTF